MGGFPTMHGMVEHGLGPASGSSIGYILRVKELIKLISNGRKTFRSMTSPLTYSHRP
jgi:hypothetical protein